MSFSKQTVLIFNGVTVAVLAVLSTLLDYSRQSIDAQAILPAIQLTATFALLFGLLRAHDQHKAKFLLVWLGSTTVFVTCLLSVIVDFAFRNAYIELLPIIFVCLSVVGILFIMDNVYKHYVLITQGEEEAKVKPPPSYSNLQSLVVSLEK